VIVTVTPNPSIDRTLRIPALVRGGLNRANSTTAELGGKGINVARALATHGYPAIAIAPLSPSSATVAHELLDGAAGLVPVEIGGDMRTNVSLVEADGTVTKINESGPRMTATETRALLARVGAVAAGAAWIVGSGSLPPGIGDDFYARLAAIAPSGTRVAIDTEGAPLRACIGNGVAAIKPNRRELELLVGREVRTLGAAVASAGEIVEAGVQQVLVSLGVDGALLVDRDGAIHAEARIDDVRNTVGAGDALLAGFLSAGGDRSALATGVAWAVAACRSPGSRMRPVTEVDRDVVVVRRGTAGERKLAA
jgi:1-phosphofructokinase